MYLIVLIPVGFSATVTRTANYAATEIDAA